MAHDTHRRRRLSLWRNKYDNNDDVYMYVHKEFLGPPLLQQ